MCCDTVCCGVTCTYDARVGEQSKSHVVEDVNEEHGQTGDSLTTHDGSSMT